MKNGCSLFRRIIPFSVAFNQLCPSCSSISFSYVLFEVIGMKLFKKGLSRVWASGQTCPTSVLNHNRFKMYIWVLKSYNMLKTSHIAPIYIKAIRINCGLLSQIPSLRHCHEAKPIFICPPFSKH